MLKISELFQAVDVITDKVYDDSSINNVITDSRSVQTGDAFVALLGENFDGHEFCQAAVAKGAKVLLVSKEVMQVPADVVVIKVLDTLEAYQKIASYYRSKFTLPVVAVTGSSGKTSTKDIIASTLSFSKKVLKSQGNFNNEVGLPKTLLNLASSYEVAVVEMGMRGLGQIRELAKIAKPNIGVVTNVNNTHIELLGSVENIAKAKSELISELSANSWSVLNFDDPYVKSMEEHAKGKVFFYGLDTRAHFHATNIENKGAGTQFICLDKINNRKLEVYLPLLGNHNVYNALAAIAVCTALDIDADAMLQGLAKVTLSGMRQEIEEFKDMLFINDAYNASPASMQAALELLKDIKAKQKVAVLSDMLELGEVSEEAHSKLGELVADKKIDNLIAIGKMSKFTHQRAQELGVASMHFDDKQQAANALYDILKKGTAVLFKGSRGMSVEEVIKKVKEKFE